MRVNITAREAEELLTLTPDITAEQDEQLSRLFQNYLFYQTYRGYDAAWERWCHCAACDQEFYADRGGVEKTFWDARHNGDAICPLCGAPVILKEIAKSRDRKNLYERHKVLLLRNTEHGLFIRAAWAVKDYTQGRSPCVALSEVARYYLAPGKSAMWRWQSDWTGLGISPGGKDLRVGWTLRKNICEPFQTLPYFSHTEEGYFVFGVEELHKSALRYCGFEDWTGTPLEDGNWTARLVRYLGEYTGRPQLELLAKAEILAPIQELVCQGRAGGGLLDWKAKTPWGLYRMDKLEFRAFRALGGDLRELQTRRDLSKEHGIVLSCVRVAELAKLYASPDGIVLLYETSKQAGASPEEAERYLEKQVLDVKRRDAALRDWRDYLVSAKLLGYDMTRRDVCLPKRLAEAHDRATTAVACGKNELLAKAYQTREEALLQQYEFRLDGYLIRVPHTMDEIVREGKTLAHCVGGYAERHMKGAVTILFLRGAAEPDTPLATVEMNGSKLVQVRGDHNDRNAAPARETYAAFLDPWLKWVAAGSKRDGQGNPKISKKREESAA